MFVIKTKKQYDKELNEAYEKGRCEQQEVGWRNEENRNIHEALGKICERLERLENKGKKPKPRCPHLGNAVSARFC